MDASSPREGAARTVADTLQIPTQGELSMKTHSIRQGLSDRYRGAPKPKIRAMKITCVPVLKQQ